MTDEVAVESLKAEREVLRDTIRKYSVDLETHRKVNAQAAEESAVQGLLIRALTSRIQELERKLGET
jgi:cobalamin biosynthesis protein CbiG